MANCVSELDDVFLALADPTRRSVVRHLGRGPASVSELAHGRSMSLPSFLKHVHTLERAGLIHTAKSGRVRTCTLDRARFALVHDWLDEERQIWEARTDRLEQLVTRSPHHPKDAP